MSIARELGKQAADYTPGQARADVDTRRAARGVVEKFKSRAIDDKEAYRRLRGLGSNQFKNQQPFSLLRLLDPTIHALFAIGDESRKRWDATQSNRYSNVMPITGLK